MGNGSSSNIQDPFNSRTLTFMGYPTLTLGRRVEVLKTRMKYEVRYYVLICAGGGGGGGGSQNSVPYPGNV